MNPLIVMAVFSIIPLFATAVDANVILITKDGNVLSWENHTEEGIYHCTRKRGGGISCIPKTEILSTHGEVTAVKDTDRKGRSGKSAYKEKLFTYREARETGCSSKIEYLDGKGKITKREYLSTDEFADEKGYNRTIDYFDGNGKKTRKEFFSTDRYASENGYVLSIIYYDSDGDPAKTEFYYLDKYADKNGYNKRINYFDSNKSAITKTEFYINNRLIKTSNK